MGPGTELWGLPFELIGGGEADGEDVEVAGGVVVVAKAGVVDPPVADVQPVCRRSVASH